MIDGHDTICNVLEKIRKLVAQMATSDTDIEANEANKLIDEAKGYAQSMSAKLVEYKREKKERENADK